MKLSVQRLTELFHTYPEEFRCAYFSDVALDSTVFKAGSDITPGDLVYLQGKNITEVEIIYNVTMYEYLNRKFPELYRKGVKWLDFFEIDRYLEEIDKINGLTRRKRFLYIIGDVYGPGSKPGETSIIIRHNEKVDYKKWNSIKRFIDRGQRFFCRHSENGIILFVSFKPEQGSSYVDKFRKHTDLITAMVSRRKDETVEIATDFIPTEDVVSVTDPNKLLDEYVRSSARLIIIGESISPSYREALLSVKNYDRFVRMMVVPTIDPTNIDHFLMEVKMVYNSDRWNK